jgi:UPF0716 protein FxsA
MWLLAVFIAVPLIEIALFIEIGGWLTLWPTLAIVVLTAILGTALVRRQGRDVLNDLRGSLNDLRDPSEPLVHGAMILLAGALLLTPGFMTDAFGFALLVPQFRKWAFRRIQRHVTILSAGGHGGGAQGPRSCSYRDRHGDVIEGDYQAHDDPPPPSERGGEGQGRKPPSGWTRH